MLMCMKTQVPLLDFPSGKLNMNNVVFNPRRHKEKVVILMGATGTGKSRLSIYLGQFSGGNHKLRQNASALGTSHSHQ
jgi:ABC-type lipoprotein export system ATPase subunit